MKKERIMRYTVCFFALFFLMVPDGSAGWEEMEVLKYNFDISVTPRHEWYPYTEYNPNDQDFMVVWRSSGVLRDNCEEGDDYDCTNSFQSIHGQRVSPDGLLLGDKLQWSPPEIGHKQVPRLAHNIFANEYMLAFIKGPAYGDTDQYIARMDNVGNILSGPSSLFPGEYAILPIIIFNPIRREYLVVYNDRNVFNAYLNNVGFILDEGGNIEHGPFPVGNQVGDFYAPYAAYNPTNDTYLVVWEDFRNVVDWMYDPCDVYGALLDGDDGSMILEIAVLDDYGTPGVADQRVPVPCYNSDKNEFLVAWRDDRPALDDYGIMGRIVNADGTLAGPEFLVLDGPGQQGTIEPLYIPEEQKYFVSWTDNRNSEDPGWYYFLSDNSDIYAGWLDDTGSSIGDEIILCDEPGGQMHPEMAYDPVEQRFLITWYDWNAPYDYGLLGEVTNIGSDVRSNVRATLYGIPTSTVISIGDQWANCGDVGVKIPICLINLEVEVGAVQIDLCENLDDCLICVGCEMTERTTIFDCMVNELENGCCAVVVFSKNPGGVINPGECDIVIIDYTIRDDPQCCNSCIRIDGENLEVVDQYGYIMDSIVSADGMVCPFECGDIEPAGSTASWSCGDGDVDIFDILEEVDFIIHVKDPNSCQVVRANVPTGTPPDCEPPDDTIDVGDLMVIIDMALNRQDCCSYYYGGVIY